MVVVVNQSCGCQSTFDYNRWTASFPEFTSCDQATAQGYFNMAGLFFRNDGTGPVRVQSSMDSLMDLLTAHVAALFTQAQGDPSPGAPKDPNSPVGRVTSAGQGSVNVTMTNDHPPGSAQWYQQTKYGSMFWAATTPYRRFRYRRGFQGDPAAAGLYGVLGLGGYY